MISPVVYIPLSSDRSSGEDVVAVEGDSRVVAGGDSLADIRAEGIFNTGDGHQGQVTREVIARNLVGRVETGAGGGPALKILVAECDSSQHLICVEGDCPRNVIPGDLIDHLRFDLRVDVLSVIRVLVDDNVMLTFLGEDLRRALENRR